MDTRTRRPRGQATGGQFSPRTRHDSRVTLSRPTDSELLTGRFPGLDAFVIRDGEVVDIDPASVTGRELSGFQALAGNGFEKTL